MRAAWLGIGLAVLVPAGVVLLAGRKQASASEPATEPRLTPGLEATLKQWLDALDVDNIGQPGHKVPSAETIAGATLFANQLQTSGYPTEAEALRTAIALASALPEQTGGQS